MQLSSVTRSLLAVATAILVGACGGAASNSGTSNATPAADVGSGQLQGAGATFPEPFYTKAFYQYNLDHSQVSINYVANGSGAGIKAFQAGTVDFGASDVPMADADIAAAGGDASLVQVPTILGV